MTVTTVDFFHSAETKKATRLRWLHSKWKSGVFFRQPRCLAVRLSQRGCRMGVKAGLSGTQFLPLERAAWILHWTQPHGWVTPSSLLREPVLHGMPRIPLDG